MAGRHRAERAHDVVRLAEARTTHPATMAVFADGALSVDQAAIATKAPSYLDDHFAEVAPLATVAQLRIMMRAARPAPPKPVPEHEETFKAHFDDDGRYRFQGVLDADHGRLVDAALTAARDALFHDGHTKVSWADAVVEMAQRSMDAATPARRERFRVTWFLDPTNPVPASWIDGIAIPDWLREHLSCDGTVSPTFTAGGRPVNVGRSQRDIPERTRRLVLHRDKKCRVPGCTQTRWLQVHHVEHRVDGGPDDTPNLVALCPADHRLHHQGRLGITGDADEPDGLTFTDARGDVIDPAARPTVPTRPPPDPKVPYEHPLRRTDAALVDHVPRPTTGHRRRRLTRRYPGLGHHERGAVGDDDRVLELRGQVAVGVSSVQPSSASSAHVAPVDRNGSMASTRPSHRTVRSRRSSMPGTLGVSYRSRPVPWP